MEKRVSMAQIEEMIKSLEEAIRENTLMLRKKTDLSNYTTEKQKRNGYINTYDAAEYLGVSRYIINKLAASGELKRYKFGGQYRYSTDDLEECKRNALVQKI